MNKTLEVSRTVEDNKTSETNKALEVKVITMAALDAKMKAGEAIQVLNVLDPQYYNLGMIKGSLMIPAAELEKRSVELDKSEEVVTYCADLSCGASRKAAELLAAKGFKVSAYEGGINEWVAAKLPVEDAPMTAPAAKAAV